MNTKLKLFFLITVFCILTSGCIRLTGGAGVWKQKGDEAPETHTASFDTADFIPVSGKNSGSLDKE